MMEMWIIPVWYFLSFPSHSAAPPAAVSYPELSALKLDTCCAVFSQHFFCFTSASSNLFCPDFTHLQLFSTTCTAWLFFITTLLFISKSSCLLSCLLFCPRLRGKGVFSLRARSISSCSVWLLLSHLSLPLSLPLSLSVSQFDRDLNRLCGDYTIALN